MVGLAKIAAEINAPTPVFFDPNSGDVRETLSDIRGDDCVQVGSLVQPMLVATVPLRLAQCARMLTDGEDRRRDLWSQCRELREALVFLVSTVKFVEMGVEAREQLNQAVASADELLDRLGVETFEGES